MVVLTREWDSKFVLSYMTSCILDDKGVPILTDKYPGRNEKLPKRQLLMFCRDYDDVDLLPSYLLINVPKEIDELVRKESKDDRPEWLKVYVRLVDKFLERAMERSKEYNKRIKKAIEATI